MALNAIRDALFGARLFCNVHKIARLLRKKLNFISEDLRKLLAMLM